jgi:hypothetical protein
MKICKANGKLVSDVSTLGHEGKCLRRCKCGGGMIVVDGGKSAGYAVVVCDRCGKQQTYQDASANEHFGRWR